MRDDYADERGLLEISIFDEVAPEEEERMIGKAFKFISKYGLEDAALLVLYSVKPVTPIGGALGRFFLGPFTPFIGHREETFITTFEQPKNVEKLIDIIVAKRKEERAKKEEERRTSRKEDKRGLRRLWPF